MMTRRSPAKLAALLTAILGTISLIGACGASSSPTPAAQASSQAPAATSASQAPSVAPAVTTAAQTAAPSQATLKVGWASEPDVLNPLTTHSSEAKDVLRLIYDTLLCYGVDLKPEPCLAASYEYSSNGTAITFHLQPNATWSDGQAVTSSDVKYTFEEIHTNNLSSYATYLAALSGVDTPDPSTAVVRFSAPQAFNPGLAVPILPMHIWSAKSVKDVQAFTNDQPVGSGPFVLADWKKGETLTVARNQTFWGTPANPAKIVWVLYANEDVMAQALKNGDVDILTEVPPTIWDGLKGAANVKAVSLPSFSFHHIGLNVSVVPGSKGNPLLKDKVVRQALSLSLDRNQLVQIALAGHGKPGTGLIPIGMSEWYWQPSADEALAANPAKATQLLDSAGYTDRNGDGVRESPAGKPLEFRLIAIESTTVDVRAAQLFKDAASKVGIKLDLTTLDENTLGNTVYNTDAPDWDIFVWGWDSKIYDPNYLLAVPLCSQIGNNNDVFYCDKAYDDLYAKQAATVDPAARKALTDQMQQMYYDNAAYIVMWYQDKLQAYRTDKWTGWTEVPGGMIFNFTRDNYLNVTPMK
jgi:peptide/nickel transport system substrate-binding protein